MALATNYSREFKSESPYSVVKIPREKIRSIWKAVWPFLEVGLTVAPELKVEEVVEGLHDQSIQLWAVLYEDDDEDTVEVLGAFLTSVENDRGEWVVSLYALGGHTPRLWVEHCDAMMQLFALTEGAVRVRMCGRKAWSRLLPPSFEVTGMRAGHFIYGRPVAGADIKGCGANL